MHPGESYPSSPWLKRFEPAPAGSQFQLRTSRLPDPDSPSELPVWCTDLTGREILRFTTVAHSPVCVCSQQSVPGSTLPSSDEKMLLSRIGFITFWTDIWTLRPLLNSGPTTQRTYGSRPCQGRGQDGPVSWLRHRTALWVTLTPGQVTWGVGLT